MYEFKRDGEVYGALTVIRKDHASRETYWWLCRCKCGEYRKVEESRLIRKQIATCLKCEIRNKEAKL